LISVAAMTFAYGVGQYFEWDKLYLTIEPVALGAGGSSLEPVIGKNRVSEIYPLAISSR